MLDAIRAAVIDEIRLAGEPPSYRRRQKIELELSDVRRGIELLGFPCSLYQS